MLQRGAVCLAQSLSTWTSKCALFFSCARHCHVSTVSCDRILSTPALDLGPLNSRAAGSRSASDLMQNLINAPKKSAMLISRRAGAVADREDVSGRGFESRTSQGFLEVASLSKPGSTVPARWSQTVGGWWCTRIRAWMIQIRNIQSG